MYILDEVSDYTFNDFQFGFFKGRGTSTSTALAHDNSFILYTKWVSSIHV